MMTLKKRIIGYTKSIFSYLILFVVLSVAINYIRSPKVDNIDISNIKLQLIDTSVLDLKSIKGEPFVLHFWGTWCPVCKQEIGNIDTVSKDYKVLGVAVKSGNNRDIKEFMRNRDLNFWVYNDSRGDLAREFNISIYPTTLIYDKRGKLRFAEVGYISRAGLYLRLLYIGLID